MKNKILIVCIVICISLTGCGEKKLEDYGEEYNQMQDAQNFSALQEAAATENGFYVIQDNCIYFIDSKSGKTVPLCGKPNCKHKDNSCNAYFRVAHKIQVYDGNIYVVARGVEERTESLYRMSLDGSKREELKVLYAYEEDDVSCSLDFVIHRGYGYMVTNWIQKDRKERTQTMYRISLDSSEEKEEIAKVTGYIPLIYINEGRGNKIYFNTKCYMDVDEKNLEILNYEFDILEETIQKISVPDGMIVRAAKNNRYFCSKEDGKRIYSFDKDGNNQNKIFDWQYDNTIMYHDDKYLYLDNEVYLIVHDRPNTERRVVVIDYNGNKICEWKKFGTDNLTVLWSDSKQLLLKNTEELSYQILNLDDVSTLQ